MTTNVQTIIPNTDGSVVTISSDDQNDILRILALAGVEGAEEEEISNDIPIEIPGAEVDEEADFDIADQDNEPAGHEVDPSTYIWNGPQTPQRLVKGFAGDNPLVNEFHKKIVNDYERFLAENDDRENADGNESPLTNPTKPEFDKDPLSGETPVDDGSNSPMSTIVRQPVLD